MSFKSILHIEPQRTPQYEYIKNDKNPILIWGCGALARSVYEYCLKYNIKVEGCFVDLEKATEPFEENLPVFALEEATAKYHKFSVIIGHSDYERGLAVCSKMKNIERAYCLSSVCYVKDLISIDFLNQKSSELDFLYQNLWDQKSRDCLRSYFESRINDRPAYMFPYDTQDTGYFNNDVFRLAEDGTETLLDIGACVGSAVWQFLKAVNHRYRSVIALEPEENNYQRLVENITKRNLENITAKQVCAYNRNGSVRFEGVMERGGVKDTKQDAVYKMYLAQTIDSLCNESVMARNATILKINFPFSVSEVLEGAGGLLKNQKPRLVIRAGFDENVLLNTYFTIRDLNPDYKVFLRYTVGIPQGLTIFAV